MEQVVFIDQQELMLDNGSELKLNYYVIEHADENETSMYGIKVEKSGFVMEVENTGPISYSREWVLRICHDIARNLVTPIGLLDIIDDMITAG